MSTKYVERKQYYPTFSQALWLLVAALALSIALSLFLRLLNSWFNWPPIHHPTITGIVNSLVIAILLWWGLKRTQTSAAKLFPFGAVPLYLLFQVVLTVIGLSILLSELDNLILKVAPAPVWMHELFDDLLGGKKSFFGSILLITIIAPFSEELLSRGLFLNGFLRNYSVKKAILGSAILFGLLHLNPWQFFHATILGVFFAWLFVKTDSLVPCILGHSLSNALPFTLKSILAWEIKGYTSDLSHHIQFQPLWFNLAGLVLTLVGLWFLSNRLGGSVPCRMTFYDK